MLDEVVEQGCGVGCVADGRRYNELPCVHPGFSRLAVATRNGAHDAVSPENFAPRLAHNLERSPAHVTLDTSGNE